MTPKQKIIAFIFRPIIEFFENSLKISGFFVAFIFILLIAVPILKRKTKTDMDVLRKVLIVIALIIGLIFGIIDTLRIRAITQ